MATREEIKTELLRKLFHAIIVMAFIPIAAISKGILILIVVAGLILYLFHEAHAGSGGQIPFFTTMIQKVKRLGEEEIARAPFLMGGGILVTTIVFPFRAAATGLLQLALCDMAAALVGMTWGRRSLSHSPKKTLEGSAAYLIVAIIVSSFLFPWPVNVLIALAGTLIESLPYKDWDNFLIPVVVAAVASFFL